MTEEKYNPKLKYFHEKFSKQEGIKDKKLKLSFAKFCLNLVEETPKDYSSIQNTCYLITGFIQYNFNDKLDEIISIAGELELPKEHVSGDVFKKLEQIKKILINYIK